MKSIVANKHLIAACGLYCGACRKYISSTCHSCHENEKATWCKIGSCVKSKNFEAEEAIVFRKTTEEDIPVIATILKAAVERMLSEGKHQWDHSYPNENHVRADMANGNGYVLVCNNKIVAYGAVIFDGEATYNSIRGEWLDDEPYVVVHRMAVLPSSQKKVTEYLS